MRANGIAAAQPGDRVGPGPRRRHRARQAGVVFLAELQHAGPGRSSTTTARCSALPRPRPARRKARFLYAGMDDHYFVSMVLNDPNAAAVSCSITRRLLSRNTETADHRPLRRLFSVRFRAPHDDSALLLRARRRSTTLQGHRYRDGARHQLRHVLPCSRCRCLARSSGCTASSATGAGRSRR